MAFKTTFDTTVPQAVTQLFHGYGTSVTILSGTSVTIPNGTSVTTVSGTCVTIAVVQV